MMVIDRQIHRKCAQILISTLVVSISYAQPHLPTIVFTEIDKLHIDGLEEIKNCRCNEALRADEYSRVKAQIELDCGSIKKIIDADIYDDAKINNWTGHILIDSFLVVLNKNTIEKILKIDIDNSHIGSFYGYSDLLYSIQSKESYVIRLMNKYGLQALNNGTGYDIETLNESRKFRLKYFSNGTESGLEILCTDTLIERVVKMTDHHHQEYVTILFADGHISSISYLNKESTGGFILSGNNYVFDRNGRLKHILLYENNNITKKKKVKKGEIVDMMDITKFLLTLEIKYPK